MSKTPPHIGSWFRTYSASYKLDFLSCKLLSLTSVGQLSTPAIFVAIRCMQVWPDNPKLQLLFPSISCFLPPGFSHGINLIGCLWEFTQPCDLCVILKVLTLESARELILYQWRQELVNENFSLPSLGWTIDKNILHGFRIFPGE